MGKIFKNPIIKKLILWLLKLLADEVEKSQLEKMQSMSDQEKLAALEKIKAEKEKKKA